MKRKCKKIKCEKKKKDNRVGEKERDKQYK